MSRHLDNSDNGCEFFFRCEKCPYIRCFEDLWGKEQKRAWKWVNRDIIITVRYLKGDSTRQLAKEHNLTQSSICRIIKKIQKIGVIKPEYWEEL